MFAVALLAGTFLATSSTTALGGDLWVERDGGYLSEIVYVSYDPSTSVMNAGGFTYASDGGSWCFTGRRTAQGRYSGVTQTLPGEGATTGRRYKMRLRLSRNPDFPGWIRMQTSKYFWGSQGGWLKKSSKRSLKSVIVDTCENGYW
jgi:hypothetical protein